jgi:hypothetical protein
MEIKKLLAIGIILLFIGVAVAPSINSTVVKTSDDLVEVTSQACGIQGFGNTTVKLTREQYQNLEQYLVEFRAKLNQTTTREEAVPLFKDAVVELDKYGLLPKGMSVEHAQKLVIGDYQSSMLARRINKMFTSSDRNYSDYENYNCLIAGRTDVTMSEGPFLLGARFALLNGFIFFDKIDQYFTQHNHFRLAHLFEILADGAAYFFIVSVLFSMGLYFSSYFPLQLLSIIGFGATFDMSYVYWQLYPLTAPAHGWIHTNGLNGVKNWSGSFYGDLMHSHDNIPLFSWLIFFYFYPGILGFSGIKITIPPFGDSFYLGVALEAKIELT